MMDPGLWSLEKEEGPGKGPGKGKGGRRGMIEQA
jgi:hypothetical protein